MDKVIHKHLDNRLDLQDSSTAMLEEVFNGINLKAAMKDPKAEFARAAHVAMGIVEAHTKDAAKEGLRFAKETMAKGKVSFVESDDPKLNEGDGFSDN